MFVKNKSNDIKNLITKLSNFEKADKADIENVLQFGVKAIGSLEVLANSILVPLIKAKKELLKTHNPENIKHFLIDIVTNCYYDLDEAHYMVIRFSRLNKVQNG